MTPLPHVEPKQFDEVMAVNVTANYRLIRSLDPLLKASDAGRAVFVTSGLAQKRWAYWAAYSITKSALEAMVSIYAKECADSDGARQLLQPWSHAHRHARQGHARRRSADIADR